MATDLDIAAHLDITDRTVRELRAKGVLPVSTRGKADLDACRLAYIRHLREQAAGRRSDAADAEDLDLVQQRARLAKEQADRIAAKNAQDRGELVPVGAVTLAVVGLIELSKSRLARVPAVVAKSDPALRDRVAAAIEDAMEELSATRVQAMIGEDDNEGDEPAEPIDL
jgi:phage terminase Nu1 subunit (DNA packaging protein)